MKSENLEKMKRCDSSEYKNLSHQEKRVYKRELRAKLKNKLDYYVRFIMSEEQISEELQKQKSDIIKLLHEGKIEFEYEKADKSIRKAIGTLHPEYLPPSEESEGLNKKETKGTPRKVNPFNVRYFDIGSNAFRTFNIERFLCINEITKHEGDS